MSFNTTFIKSTNNSQKYLLLPMTLFHKVSTSAPHSLVAVRQIPLSLSTYQIPRRLQALLLSQSTPFLHSYHFNILILNISSAPTGQVQFQVNETQVILNQAYENTIGGFVPNSNQPDPNWGKCLQCAVVDRSRLNVKPTIERSAFCTKCFTQYCYNPAKLTSSAELPNRQLDYAGPSTISV